MDPQVGIGRTFREPGWLERIAARCRAAAARTPLWIPIKRTYEAVLAAVAGDGFAATLPGGERVLLHPAHRQLAWNAEEYAAFKAAARPGAIVLDIGANLGAYTVLFAQWVGSAGRVYAFEPAPETRAGLERQIALNRVAERVIVRGEAVAASTGRRRFHASGWRGDNRLIGASGDGVDVMAISIDDFCAREGIVPDVVKIDVEGGELDVLRGARQTLARAGHGVQVFMEVHPSLWPELGITRSDLEAELRQQGLMLSRIDRDGDPWSIEGVCLRVTRDPACAF